VQAVLDTFPGATIAAVRERFAEAVDGGDAGEAVGSDPGDDGASVEEEGS